MFPDQTRPEGPDQKEDQIRRRTRSEGGPDQKDQTRRRTRRRTRPEGPDQKEDQTRRMNDDRASRRGVLAFLSVGSVSNPLTETLKEAAVTRLTV